MELGRKLVFMQFGSHVYGTNVPTSDLDFKGIFIPRPADILMQRAVKTSINHSTKENERAKNSKDDVDTEFFTLQGFLRLCAEGQTVAIDMLFTPQSFWKESSIEWENIQRYRNLLIHKGTSAFVGYCQQQAAKYGIKGSRVAAVRQALEFLKQLDPHSKLHEHERAIETFAYPGDMYSGDGSDLLIRLTVIKAPSGKLENHLEVCGRKVGYHCTVKYATSIFQKVFDNYGQRALAAEKNESVDWKALMHAVRVCEEAKELLSTGHVTFPRPEADLLLKIRTGEMPYKEVAPLIEQGVADIERLQKESVLPDKIDAQWEHWNLLVHVNEIYDANYCSWINPKNINANSPGIPSEPGTLARP